MPSVNFAPACTPSDTRAFGSVEQAEALLTQWFDRPVILTSSGRSALLLCFQELGLNRYSSRVAMTPRTAQCVFDAVVRAAFPVDPSTDQSPVDATLLIHQYGHRLKDRPSGPVVEDICHAFFETAKSGARDWAGDFAVFSLPKFFGTRAMCGGVVVADDTLARQIRARRDSQPAPCEALLERDQAAWRSGASRGLEEIYIRALLHPACSLNALSGLPSSLDGLRAVGEARATITRMLLDAIPETALGGDWRTMCSANLPFALPVFANDEQSSGLIEEIGLLDIETGRFRINFARSMMEPETRLALLLPCHEGIAGPNVEALAIKLGKALHS